MTGDTQALDPAGLAELERFLSSDRLSTYLTAANHDVSRALSLYLWNARLGEAFHTPIQAVEVGLRNGVDRALVAAFGPEWWRTERFEVLIRTLDPQRRVDLEQVLRRLEKRRVTPGTGRIVAGLSFGFWIALLQKRYVPAIWSSRLAIGFPHLPEGRTRRDLADRAREVGALRNRISHHEPIFRNDVSHDFANIMELLAWICPTAHDWLRPHCRVHEVMREKP